MNTIATWLMALTVLSGSLVVNAALGDSASIPAAASAVGYTTLTFNSTTLGSTSGTWQSFNFYGSSQPANYAVQSPDGSILLGSLVAGGYGHGFATISTAHALQGWPAQTWQGVAFGGGFFARAVFSFTGQTNTSDYGKGHPVWWMLDIEQTSQDVHRYLPGWPVPPNTAAWNSTTGYTYGQYVGYGGRYYVCILANTNVLPTDTTHWTLSSAFTDSFEVDFMEYDVQQFVFQMNAGNWYGGNARGGAISTKSPWSSFRGVNGAVTVPNTTDFSQPHTYDCLWVPATATTQGYIQFYMDEALIAGPMRWNQWQVGQLPPPVTNVSAMAGMDLRHMFLIFGTGTSYPMTVHSVQVWQASAANNWVLQPPPTAK
jgi:hypothetical protein